jgi:spore germination protein KB
MKNVEITSHQLLALTANYTCGAAILVTSAATTAIAKQDAWISALLASLFGIPIVLLIYFLGKLYPDMTFVEIIVQAFGKRIGLVVACSFILYCLELENQVIWYMGDFINLQVMPETPVAVINLIFVIVIVMAILYGLETIARASEILLYFM